MADLADSTRRTTSRQVAAFFLSALLLLSSGRIASSDAGAQLQAALLLVTTGGLSFAGPVAPPGWAHAPNGRIYQVHDLGNVLMMLPPAAAGAWLSTRPSTDLVTVPPIVSRAATSLVCASMAAVACIWMFQLLAIWHPPRTAFLLAALMPAGTIFIAYARSAWDVLGACCFMAGALRYSASAMVGERAHLNVIRASAALAAACTFRYSLLPFFASAGLVLLWRHRRTFPAHATWQAGVVFAVLMLPSLAYNHVRTGVAWRPATTLPHLLATQNALSGDVLPGLYGLLLSPNRGLFAYSPLLILLVAIPALWQRLDAAQRTLIGHFGTAAAAYTVMIACMRNWGAFGWGPRYLVPVLPIVFVAAAFAIARSWERRRPVILAVVLLSCVAAVPPALVNWHLATTAFPEALDPGARRPYQQMAAWRTLFMGLRGRDLRVPPDVGTHPLRRSTAQFPDLLIVRVARMSGVAFAIAVACGALGLWIAVRAAARLLGGLGP